MWVASVVAGSRYTSANASIVTLVVPPFFAALKSTTGTITKQGSPAGMLFGFPPEHGSAMVGHPLNRVVKASLTGPVLTPGSVYIVWPTVNVPDEPPVRLASRVAPPVPSRSTHCQLPGRFMVELTNLLPNDTGSPATNADASVHGNLH